jgi:hypothetical protein
MCRHAEVVATVSLLMSLLPGINYHQCCCYRRLIIAGEMKIDENMGQGKISGVNDTFFNILSSPPLTVPSHQAILSLKSW